MRGSGGNGTPSVPFNPNSWIGRGCSADNRISVIDRSSAHRLHKQSFFLYTRTIALNFSSKEENPPNTPAIDAAMISELSAAISQNLNTKQRCLSGAQRKQSQSGIGTACTLCPPPPVFQRSSRASLARRAPRSRGATLRARFVGVPSTRRCN